MWTRVLWSNCQVSTSELHLLLILPLLTLRAGCQVSYFFSIFSYFLKNSYFLLFFPIFHRNSYFFLFFSAQFFSTFILFFSQKLKEASEIRWISCSGKSHSCEIASLCSFSPKWSHDQPASVVLPQSRAYTYSWQFVYSGVYFACISVFMKGSW